MCYIVKHGEIVMEEDIFLSLPPSSQTVVEGGGGSQILPPTNSKFLQLFDKLGVPLRESIKGGVSRSRLPYFLPPETFFILTPPFLQWGSVSLPARFMDFEVNKYT